MAAEPWLGGHGCHSRRYEKQEGETGVNIRSPSGDIFNSRVCGYADVELEERPVAEDSIWG